MAAIKAETYGKNIIRITYGEAGRPAGESLIVTAKAEDHGDNEVRCETGEKSVRFIKNGSELSAVEILSFEPCDSLGEAYRACISIDIDKNETLFGLGSHDEGFPCLNGRFAPLYQENRRIALPYFVSNKGYAYLFDCTSFMTFDNTEPAAAKIYFDSTEAVDIYFIAGDCFEDICGAYRRLTGVTPMLPKWACGYIQSKERYKTQQELLDVAREYRKRRIPLDAIVQDWQYWENNLWGQKSFDTERYPDMKACTDELHAMHVHLMISIWPNVSGDSSNRCELKQNNMLLGDDNVYNAFDEKARDVYWRQAYEGLYRYGIDGWWCDSSEPYDSDWGGAVRAPLAERMEKSIGEYKKYIDGSLINAFSLVHSKGIYEHQRSVVKDKRVINLTRSAMCGQHRYATVVWSGDVSASWDTLARQVHIMQNYIACGEAYWNSDIGGFFTNNSKDLWFWSGEFPEGVNDEEYRELYVRWLQFAVFTPMMRSHGTDTPREIWQFGEEGSLYYDAIKKGIELRSRLLPFFYSVNAAVTLEGRMPVKPLALVYTDDEAACGAFDEYLYGDALLICPVTEPRAKLRRIYLPAGVWYDFHTNEKYMGGKYIDVACKPDVIPVFAKAGAVIPTVEPMQYADEDLDAVYTVLIYPGADGRCLLYNDDGITYDYERGEYSLTEIVYNDSTGAVGTKELQNSAYAHPLEFRIVN